MAEHEQLNIRPQRRRFSLPFYVLMLRSRGGKSLDLWDFAEVFLTGQGVYTETLKNAVLLRNKPTIDSMWHTGELTDNRLPVSYTHLTLPTKA